MLKADQLTSRDRAKQAFRIRTDSKIYYELRQLPIKTFFSHSKKEGNESPLAASLSDTCD